MITDSGALRNNTTESQCKKILAMMQAGRRVNPLMVDSEVGCRRLAARIKDLEKVGHAIHHGRITTFNRFGQKCRVAEYWMDHPAKGGDV